MYMSTNLMNRLLNHVTSNFQCNHVRNCLTIPTSSMKPFEQKQNEYDRFSRNSMVRLYLLLQFECMPNPTTFGTH